MTQLFPSVTAPAGILDAPFRRRGQVRGDPSHGKRDRLAECVDAPPIDETAPLA
jgi:hypothetical protein